MQRHLLSCDGAEANHSRVGYTGMYQQYQFTLSQTNKKFFLRPPHVVLLHATNEWTIAGHIFLQYIYAGVYTRRGTEQPAQRRLRRVH